MNTKQPQNDRASRPFPAPRQSGRPRGAILVWFALMLPLLLGTTGLVIDAGLLMATQRQLQNSVDAAAMAAAYSHLEGESLGELSRIAINYVTVHHGFSQAVVSVNSPPERGPYANDSGYVEVVANSRRQTLFMHLLSDQSDSGTVTARAVAGGERVELIDGIIALNPHAIPGLTVTGNAKLNVTGRIIVNSEGGGVDANGELVDANAPGTAAFAANFARVRAREVYLVGGANRPDGFESYRPGGPNPLKTGQLPVADPLRRLPTPTVENGVIDVRRGAPMATQGKLVLNNATDTSAQPNYIETDPATGEETMVLHPGIYSQIDIQGGNVRFEPGIYVLAADANSPHSLRIIDGNINAQGVMFYNTTENYDPVTGGPDQFDGESSPFNTPNSRQVRINAALGFSSIDTDTFAYGEADPNISAFDGMLLYQRRKLDSLIQVQGFSGSGGLRGTVYAKWANFRLPAGGWFESQLVVGSVQIPGHGDLTIDYRDQDLVKTIQVFLVE